MDIVEKSIEKICSFPIHIDTFSVQKLKFDPMYTSVVLKSLDLYAWIPKKKTLTTATAISAMATDTYQLLSIWEADINSHESSLLPEI